MKVLIEWHKNFTGGRVLNIETDDWEGEGIAKLKAEMEELEPKKFEERVKADGFKDWKQSIEYKTRYVLLDSLEK